MQFNTLPSIDPTIPTELLAYQSTTGTVGKVANDYQAQLDGIIASMVMSAATQQQSLQAHISNSSIHLAISDSTVSNSATWSSAKIDAAIAGSDAWFNLDSIPEGSVNLYYTPQRGADLVAATTQGITQVDHQAIASQLISLLLGFNNTVFRYDVDPGYSGVEVSVDGNPVTVDFFEVTPGLHDLSFPGESNIDWTCKQLAHKIRLDDGLQQQITPKLTLDAFGDGEINKLWSEQTLGDSEVLADLVDHIDTNFATYHTQINDNAFADDSSTWSSVKMYTELINAANNASYDANKKIAIIQETASQGSHPSTYVWETVDNQNGTFTHFIRRRHGTYSFTDDISVSADYFVLEMGTWLVYWSSDTQLNPYFTNVTQVATFMTPRFNQQTITLAHPGVYTETDTSSSYHIVTRFTCNQDYSSTYRNNWLVPKNVPGVRELYSVLQLERIR